MSATQSPDEAESLAAGYRRWRLLHPACSAAVTLVALVHMALTLPMSGGWGPDALWFLGAGMGLLTVATLNQAHAGVSPCRMPTTRLVRAVNWCYACFAAVALTAAPELHTWFLMLALVLQAIASQRTLPGPAQGVTLRVNGTSLGAKGRTAC